jgi:hypothetical protein
MSRSSSPGRAHSNGTSGGGGGGSNNGGHHHRHDQGGCSSSPSARVVGISIRCVILVLALYPFVTIHLVSLPPVMDAVRTLDDSAFFRSASSEKSKNMPGGGGAVAPTNKKKRRDATAQAHQRQHRVAGLSCEAYGGPSPEVAEEMVYWKDIPQDATFVSPLKHPTEEQYLTFEPDEAGWNNLRMAMETAVGLAIAMGRTLVMPPDFYKLRDSQKHSWHAPGVQDKQSWGFSDFYHFDAVEAEHVGLKIISFQEFLETVVMTGNFRDSSGNPSFPPENRTDWNGLIRNNEGAKVGGGAKLWPWMRQTATPLLWKYFECVAGIPSERGSEAAYRMKEYLEKAKRADKMNFPDGKNVHNARVRSYAGHPTPVDDAPHNRLLEMLYERKEVCVYDETLQNAKVLHGYGEQSSGYRLLIHFYAFLFFEDWRQDLWHKRFVRDHLRYLDELQCGAARIVERVRAAARANGDPEGSFDAIHIRRDDCAYKNTCFLSKEDIYEKNLKDMIPEGRTVYVATDEKDLAFFDLMRQHYKLLFLRDFMDEIKGLDPHYYGIIEQLVATRADTFVGTFYSTFSGFINRLRGYHSIKDHPEKTDGAINSYYLTGDDLRSERNVMQSYNSVRQAYWQQEFPVAWRDIDHDVKDSPNDIVSVKGA